MENSEMEQEQNLQAETPAEEAESSQAAQPEQPAETAETAEAEVVGEQPDAEDKLAAELAQVKDQLLRTMAEYDNHRKRTANEKLLLRADTISSVVADFLPVVDNLERALAAECSDENYKQGVQMIYDSFMEALGKLGVTVIESDGADFDPQLHQAVQRVDKEGVESGKVATTFAKGYMIDKKVIRFAMVAVAN
ncbi:MAG: nucleotide exchange factor GrpE [Oscillospiraceae bacterium]